MNKIILTCPNCNDTFSVDEMLHKVLKEKEQKYQEKLKVKEKLLEEKYKLLFKLKEKSLWCENMIFRNYNHQYMLYTKKTYKLLCNITNVVSLDTGCKITYVN